MLVNGIMSKGFDFGKMIFDVTKKADGSAGASVGPPIALGMQGVLAIFFSFVSFSVATHCLVHAALGLGMGMVRFCRWFHCTTLVLW